MKIRFSCHYNKCAIHLALFLCGTGSAKKSYKIDLTYFEKLKNTNFSKSVRNQSNGIELLENSQEIIFFNI